MKVPLLFPVLSRPHPQERVPLTHTIRIPEAGLCGSVKSAFAWKSASSNKTRSANAPSLTMPRSFSEKTDAGSDVTRRTAGVPTPDFGGHLARCDYFTVDLLAAPQATPCGVSYTAPRVCAMECAMPRPTFEKPIPAIY